MRKIILTYGLIAGAIVTAFMAFGIYWYDNHPDFDGGMYLGFTGMLVAFTFVFIGVKKYRDIEGNGLISFGKAFKIGGLIALIASTIYVGVWLIEYYNLYPDFMDKYAAAEIKKLQSSTTLNTVEMQAKIDEIMKMKDLYRNPLWVILLTYAEILPIGLLGTLISAAILKKKQPAASN